MAQAEIPQVPLTQPQRKKFFPFRFGMRSSPDNGVGAVNAINAYCNPDGHVEKENGIQLLKEITGIESIVDFYGYDKADGTSLILFLYKVDAPNPDPDYYVLRLLESDGVTVSNPIGPEESLTGTITFTGGSPTVTATSGKFLSEIAVGDWIYASGESSHAKQVLSITDNNNLTLNANYTGAGASTAGKRATVHFTGSQFDFDSIGGKVFVGNDSTTTAAYAFNGTILEKIANVSRKVYSVAKDGSRLVLSFLNSVEFSGSGIVTSLDFTAGTGVARGGSYGTSISYPKAVVSVGDGIIIFGTTGAESHKVVPNSASDDVSSNTKNTVFNYGGSGVTHPRQCVKGGNFVYIANETGIIEINPYNGSFRNGILTSQGAIREKWDNLDKSSVAIGYDSVNNYVVAVAKSRGQNDTLVVFDVSTKDRPCFISETSYFSSFAMIGNQFYAGSCRDGRIYKVFKGLADYGGSSQRFLYRTEKDGINGPEFLKTFRKGVVYANLDVKSRFTIRVYIDDNEAPIYERTFGVKNALDGGGSIEEYGRYVFGLGALPEEGSRNTIRLNQKNARFSRVSIEVEEISASPFILKGLTIEYKSRGRFVRKFNSKDL